MQALGKHEIFKEAQRNTHYSKGKLIPDKADARNKSLSQSHTMFRLIEHCSGFKYKQKRDGI